MSNKKEKDQFSFINDTDTNSELNNQSFNNIDKEKDTIDLKACVDELQLAERKKRQKRIIKIFLFEFLTSIISLCLAEIMVAYQQKGQSGKTYCNAFYTSGFITFFLGLMIFMINHNILSPMIYGLKTFGLVLLGKRPKQTYYDYIQERKEKRIPKIYFISLFVIAIPHFIVAITLHLVYYR